MAVAPPSTQQIVHDMLAELRTDVMAEASAAMGRIVNRKVQRLVHELGEHMAVLKDHT